MLILIVLKTAVISRRRKIRREHISYVIFRRATEQLAEI